MKIVPPKIKVGFNERNDTYTKKLGFVNFYKTSELLYFTKGYKRWVDFNIPEEEYNNVPISGFVINEDAGGYEPNSHSWEGRELKFRVFDPRGFEVEITMQNLFMLMEHCGISKGKCITGDLIYGWKEDQLFLLPYESGIHKKWLDYDKVLEANKFVEDFRSMTKIKKKDLKEGCFYYTKIEGITYFDGKKCYNIQTKPSLTDYRFHCWGEYPSAAPVQEVPNDISKNFKILVSIYRLDTLKYKITDYAETSLNTCLITSIDNITEFKSNWFKENVILYLKNMKEVMFIDKNHDYLVNFHQEKNEKIKVDNVHYVIEYENAIYSIKVLYDEYIICDNKKYFNYKIDIIGEYGRLFNDYKASNKLEQNYSKINKITTQGKIVKTIIWE